MYVNCKVISYQMYTNICSQRNGTWLLDRLKCKGKKSHIWSTVEISPMDLHLKWLYCPVNNGLTVDQRSSNLSPIEYLLIDKIMININEKNVFQLFSSGSTNVDVCGCLKTSSSKIFGHLFEVCMKLYEKILVLLISN